MKNQKFSIIKYQNKVIKAQFALHGTFARDLECSTRQKSSASAESPFVKCQVHPVLEPKVRTNPKFKRCQVQVHWVHKEISNF